MGLSIRLLVDSRQFWQALSQDVAAARRRVYVQALGFEGDSVGQDLARLLLDSPAADRRVLVDSFTKFRLSDKWVYHPRHAFDAELRRERRDTQAMFGALTQGGVPVRFTNPMGAFFRRGPVRNHKKLVIVDEEVAYIGGFNFGEHNFAWHDVMLRLERPEIARFLGEDFLATWRGEDLAAVREFPGITLFLFDGRRNAALFAPLVALLDAARRGIDVECAYLTAPFMGRLAAAQARGVPVRLIMSAANNWPVVFDHVHWASERAGIELRLYPERMIHMKTMLVDDAALVLGSANFDFWSYWFQQEVMGIVTDPQVIADFRARVFEPDLSSSYLRDGQVGALRGRVAGLRLHALQQLSRILNPSANGERRP